MASGETIKLMKIRTRPRKNFFGLSIICNETNEQTKGMLAPLWDIFILLILLREQIRRVKRDTARVTESHVSRAGLEPRSAWLLSLCCQPLP